ncbi:hypothetical protein [Nocardia sp. alder85J]|uniref:hypothetical protein n=1 Tax=Nocardia sp. alder85J TaxID=2862949 RepID=UPI001CD47D26|nr:hypothetical protein [Nocardia sp. alder85J]MCX4098354.1 hypothetical protein [Nocardia sp. alder85J]
MEYYNAPIAGHPQRQGFLRDVGESVAELRGAIAVQELTGADRDRFDAAELASLHLLRDCVRGVESVRLSVPHTVARERLRLTASRILLEPLAGHPTFWELHDGGSPYPAERTGMSMPSAGQSKSVAAQSKAIAVACCGAAARQLRARP